MNRKTQTRPRRTKATHQQNTPGRMRTYSLVFVCILMLVSGFFFAARQHFSSMDYGMKNSRLRRQVDELEAEKRRLLLAREVSLSPMEIKKAAKKTGLIDSSNPVSEMAQVVSTTKEKALPAAPVSGTRSLVVKTAAVSTVPPTAVAAIAKKDKPKQQKSKVTVD